MTNRISVNFPIENVQHFKNQLVHFSKKESTFCLLDSNNFKADPFSSFEMLAGVGVQKEIRLPIGSSAFQKLQNFYDDIQDWAFGFLSYDLKNEIHSLTSSNEDKLNFPELYFYQPQFVITVNSDGLNILGKDKAEIENIFEQIRSTEVGYTNLTKVEWQHKMTKEHYCETVEKLRQHIIDGDFYEINFCQEFFSTNQNFNPYSTFCSLNEQFKNPFSSYFKVNENYALCFSPERFATKKGETIITQPMKGTIGRGASTLEDESQINQLKNSEKDRAENVMIVDLMRNDLSKSCEIGSVKVDELFEVQSFNAYHQMISTVTGQLKPNIHFIKAIENMFPMGSMTGAPKHIVMEHIEQYEKTQRGLYSGSIGYITPNGGFDFNVVIRSILYNAQSNYLSKQVGGAIVYDSEPMLEYDECLLKSNNLL